MRGLVWLVQRVRAPPPARARRCGARAARRRSDGAISVDGEGRCACGIGMVEAVRAAGLFGSCGEHRLVLCTALAGDARREEGVMRAFPGAFGVDGPRIGSSERARFLLHR